ncbi:tRNA pseudouridine(38-40) synthase [hydrothermal vent metagenome]|uniref:tRNA pseudouridine(38-40) synthase n=1 Tax=hydrothermal vent metagenome TaxID=652676 RepID=A0A3B0TZA9_9ZZZZ
MARYKLTIEFDGTPFAGWQVQAGQLTVQSRLGAAIMAFSGQTVTIHGAGRTDTGVHALGQVAHIDLDRDWPAETVRQALNFHLKPDPIAILAAKRVDDDFNARFSATMRYYRYRIVNRRAPLTFDRNRAWHVTADLDAGKMDSAARTLLGRHDFTTFRSIHCQAKSPVKTLEAISVTRNGEDIDIRLSARSFMHRQVRSIAGSLKCVGEGRWPVSAMAEILAARDRSACGPVAPASGLYLTQVDYPLILC